MILRRDAPSMGHIIPTKIEQKKIELLSLTKFSSKDAHCQHQILEALTTLVFLNPYFLSPANEVRKHR